MDIRKLFREAFNNSSDNTNEKIITKVNEEFEDEDVENWEEWSAEFEDKKYGRMIVKVTKFYWDLSEVRDLNLAGSFEDEIGETTEYFSDPYSFAHLIDGVYMEVYDLKEMLENPDTELSSTEITKIKSLIERGERLADELTDFDAYLEENDYFQDNELNEEVLPIH